jgi:hypothetical protein
MLRQRQPRVHDDEYLRSIRQLPCVVCGNHIETEAAHIRFADRRAAKSYTGKQQKPDDRWAIPLCSFHHRQQHNIGEHEFWKHYGLDPVFIALALSSVSGDYGSAVQIIQAVNEERSSDGL